MVWIFLFKQKTAYEMRISDWSSDVCSSDLGPVTPAQLQLVRETMGTQATVELTAADMAELSDILENIVLAACAVHDAAPDVAAIDAPTIFVERPIVLRSDIEEVLGDIADLSSASLSPASISIDTVVEQAILEIADEHDVRHDVFSSDETGRLV